MIDRATFRVIAISVAGVLLVCVAGIITLSLFDKAIPDILENVTVGALTGLVGLLASPKGGDAPQEVEVVNAAGDPVPVKERGASDLAVVIAALVLAVALVVVFGTEAR